MGFDHLVKAMETLHTKDAQDKGELYHSRISLPDFVGLVIWRAIGHLQISGHVSVKLRDVDHTPCLDKTHNKTDCACALAAKLEQALLVNPRPPEELIKDEMHITPNIKSRTFDLQRFAEGERQLKEKKSAAEARTEEH